MREGEGCGGWRAGKKGRTGMCVGRGATEPAGLDPAECSEQVRECGPCPECCWERKAGESVA